MQGQRTVRVFSNRFLNRVRSQIDKNDGRNQFTQLSSHCLSIEGSNNKCWSILTYPKRHEPSLIYFWCVEMSDFVPNNRHLREVLIFFFHLKKTVTEAKHSVMLIIFRALISFNDSEA